MENTFFVLALIATVAVAIILLFGIGTFTRGGDFNRRNANKIMRWRLAAQFVAVILITAFVMIRGYGG
ncbi:twin transmembrane helix small protein [Nioella nitratireducens]|uniref:twin transmembrane helix small protein n=1 Tax=Nioella nitratireducens TaxID=1287720 RepID=UPI0008FD5D41|nr:twin transmembrane helix small protein [Nioella nitratireducens]